MVIIGEAPLYDTIVETEDEDATFYLCKAPSGPRAGQEVGFTPVLCPSWETPPPKSSAAIDEAWRKAEERLAARAKKEQQDE